MSPTLAQVKTEGHNHEHQATEKTPVEKSTKAPAKSEPMKCCEGMEKMGDIKDGGPKQSEMKEKMAKMKAEMKQNMAEKPQGSAAAGETQEKKSDGPEPGKSQHQH